MDLDAIRPKGPYAFIQYKGTDLCADINCSCGAGPMHIDADFVYTVRCPHCGKAWDLGCYVQLYPAEKPDDEFVKLLEPDCDVCSSSPCDHQDVWRAKGQPYPIGNPWPVGAECVERLPGTCNAPGLGDMTCDKPAGHSGMHGWSDVLRHAMWP